MNKHPVEQIVGTSAHVQRLRAKIRHWSPHDEPVLILGESGTGKEVVARAVHATSTRSHRPLHVVNCAALGGDVLMAELFGHVRGAFTGATQARSGRLRAADGATLLLDELSEAPPTLQAALLRVVEQGEVQTMGTDGVSRVNVRLMATSNRPPAELADGSAMRFDLLQRLAGFVVRIQPLRRRPEDVAPLARLFLDEIGAALDHDLVLSPRALARLETQPLRGNARELRQLLVRATTFCADGRIHALAIDEAIADSPLDANPAAGVSPLADGTLATVIRDHIAATLDATDGNLSAAARRLDVPRSTLQHYLVKYGIERQAQSSSCSA
jgi:two-component system response regulator HydG